MSLGRRAADRKGGAVFRVVTSRRLLAVALGLVVLALAGLVTALERQQADRMLRQVVADAELINELLLEVDLAGGEGYARGLDPQVSERIDRGVQLLKRDGRLVGLQVMTGDGHVLYSDSEDPAEFSPDELGLLATVLRGEAQVEFEHDDNREVPTATVLVQPEPAGEPSGLVAEVLLPQDGVSTALAASSRRLYGAAGLLVLALVGVSLLARQRMLRREHQALHDPLTGLGNRALLAETARAVLTEPGSRSRGPATTALLLLDLDGFKNVNDTLGHAAGDRLLVEVAGALRAAVRAGDLVVRLGGDEFAVLLRDLPGADAAVGAASAVGAALQRSFLVDEVALEVGGSIGVAVSPQHGHDLEGLLRSADVAMYRAKRDGGGVRLYDEASDPHDKQQLGLLSRLRTAIETDQLRLHFQPKLALRQGQTVGFEALVRWQHPELGLLPPAAFVPLAERTGLIRPLTTWVLRAALGQCAQWRAQGWDIGVAVNIAPVTLLDPDLPAQLTALLADTGVPGTALELEITETAVMVDPVRAAETIRRLRRVGVTVSIDDFGAGYTSLSYLKSLPVAALKIDRGFVTQLLDHPEDEAVARSVVGLAHDLGLTVVAEGVETSEVRQRLLELGCDEIQGFLLARPMPGADVPGWLASQHCDAGAVPQEVRPA